MNCQSACNTMRIGVLAIQGDFAAHARAIAHTGAIAIEVRRANDIASLDGLVIPGGETTTMLKFIENEGIDAAIGDFARSGKPIFGTCAGAILLAREVYNPAAQPSLGLIDIGVERNAYGRQVDSFIATVETTFEGGPLEAVFIRAPKIRRIGALVKVIAHLSDEPVLVRDGNILAATFHPELTEDIRTHSLFLEMIKRS
jgi:5'-phosphate synthase pdxT subunit